MIKKIIIINGNGEVGKDTFVELVSEFIPVMNFSSVDKVKNIAKEIGWDGVSKTEKDRKFLADLKALTKEYCDMPFESMKEKVEEFRQNEVSQCLFLHIREPEEIQRAVKEFGAITVLITRDSVKQITSNAADANVYNYSYDYEITNNGTIDSFRRIASFFAKTLLNNNKITLESLGGIENE